MRKNSIRKLIHGILDLLPLFVIPIFAININQKSVEPISIEVQEQISVDFNQIVDTSNYNQVGRMGLTFSTYEGKQVINGTSNNVTTDTLFLSLRIYLDSSDKYLFRCPNLTVTCRINNALQGFANETIQQNVEYVVFNMSVQPNTYFDNDIYTYNIFNLTQMGLEDITIEEFDVMFPDTYYPEIESQNMLVNKPTLTIYDDTDIGSQFLYSLYISTDKYFNMNNVFNLNSVYQWFEMNIFNGTAPLSIYIVWNIIIYELVMDLLMLLYALFMFFIDACQKLIDKPLNSIK